jgi:uncharacterized membrane protein
MKLTIPSRFAEICFALAMAVFGLLHLKYGNSGTGVPAFMPGNPAIWMYITGIGFLAFAFAIILNKFKRLACYLFATMLIIFILTIHLIPAIRDFNLYQPLKDCGLAMAAIIIGNNDSK